MSVWLIIGLMMLIIFLSRYVFLEPRLPLKLGENTQLFLRYSAPAVLTAIWAPIVFLADAQIQLSLGNAYLWAAFFAACLAWYKVSALFTVIASLALFLLLEHGSRLLVLFQ